MRNASEKFDSSEDKNRFVNRFTQINYTIILNHIAELNEEKIAIGVYHSLNPSIGELVIQHLKNVLGHKYPIEATLYQEDTFYDILLSNIYDEAIAENQKTTYVFSDIGNNYDMDQVEHLITGLLDK